MSERLTFGHCCHPQMVDSRQNSQQGSLLGVCDSQLSHGWVDLAPGLGRSLSVIRLEKDYFNDLRARLLYQYSS